jgi:Holliday junction resolvase
MKMTQQPSLDKILAFYNIAKYIGRRDVNDLKKKLQLNDIDLQRYTGKNIEEMFYVILLLCDNIDCIIPFNEQVSKIISVPTPDVLIILKDGRRFLIEIKSTKEKGKKVSSSRIKNQLELAKKMDCTLMYLFHIDGVWGLFDANLLIEQDRKITVADFPKYSQFESLFNISFIVIPEGLQIICVSSKKKRNTIGVATHHGSIDKLYISQLGGITYEVPMTKQFRIAYRFILGLLFHYKEKVTITKDGLDTMQKYLFGKEVIIQDFDFVLTLIKNTKNLKTKNYYSYNEFITFLMEKNIKTDQFNLKDLVTVPINLLQKHDIQVKLIPYPYEY